MKTGYLFPKSVADPETLEMGAKKHEIQAAAFGSHLLLAYFTRQGGGGLAHLPPAPWIRYCSK